MNISFPKISIVTVCYNHESFIAQTIESILSQGYPNLEYIVIDDGSTDSSWEIIQRYKNQLFHIERLEGNRPLPTQAINYGFSLSSGEILGWMNSKNILLPKSLFCLAEIFQQFQEIDWLTGLATTINRDGLIVRVSPTHKSIYDFLINRWSVIQQESTFWKRSLWEKSGPLNTEAGWAFDQSLWSSFFQQASLYHTHTALGAYRAIPEAVSRQKRSEYLACVDSVIHQLHQDVTPQYIRESQIYKICYILRPLLRSIPSSIYNQIPILKKFSYTTIEYQSMEQAWVLKRINPFRQI